MSIPTSTTATDDGPSDRSAPEFAPVPDGLRSPAVVSQPHHLRQLTAKWQGEGLTVGLVPTMGALHAGHLSLVEEAARACDRVVVSIFVNPLQFGPGEDYQAYPRELDRDLELLASCGVDLCYHPSVSDLYPAGFATRVAVGSPLTERWEGQSRPGHFDGVATVVTKLVAACAPTTVFFGQKDAQQLAVVTRLVRDLDLGAEVRSCPTVRDADGVALSSRNRQLTKAGRASARLLPAALSAVARAFTVGATDPQELEGVAREVLGRAPELAVDYAAVVDPGTFEPAVRAQIGSRLILAVRIGGVRLIDNLALGQGAPLDG